MTNDEIKLAAAKLIDIERIETMHNDVVNGNTLVIQASDVTLQVKEFAGWTDSAKANPVNAEFRKALLAYLDEISSDLKDDVSAMTNPKPKAKAIDQFEEVLAALDAQAKPDPKPTATALDEQFAADLAKLDTEAKPN